jgi:DNA-directed RNA polymerase specialized sigma24 family protein
VTANGSLFDKATASGVVDDRLVLWRALAKVPPRQRAVLVLRYWEDIPVDEAAEVLGCTPGTVKSQSARGLQALRNELGESFLRVASEDGR